MSRNLEPGPYFIRKLSALYDKLLQYIDMYLFKFGHLIHMRKILV